MFTTKPPISFGIKATTFDQLSSDNQLIRVESPGGMLRNITRKLVYSSPRFSNSVKVQFSSLSTSTNYSFLGASSSVIYDKFDKFRPYEITSYPKKGLTEMGFYGLSKDKIFSRNNVSFYGLCSKSYVSVAENVAVSSTDCEEDGNEVDELLQELKKEDKRGYQRRRWRQKRIEGGFKYLKLRKRQVKIETEAWVQAVREYRNLLKEMCDRNLAPNLPYMKSLFLGWFEPLTNKINEDQEVCRAGKNKASYAPYFDQLPADMMAVITMHKLMGLLMAGGGHGSARVVQAACAIGEAIEQEIRIRGFLEKTKKKKATKDTINEEDASDIVTKEQGKLRNTVTNLIKKQKLRTVKAIIKGQDTTKPWTPDAKAKVGSRLIELLLQTAYIQPPADQLAEGPPDIRPAFVHTFQSVTESKETKRYGVIQCDPVIRSGLEKTVRHMVIPYMPMLVPPVKWTGYDKGAHLFLPSYVMRIRGARQQREAIKRAPKKQLEFVFEALDTLGNTKWRVHKPILSVVDRIWNGGGRLADLVDRDDLPLPEQPATEDEAVLKKWKWKVKQVKKENRERHSQRCDIELKLSVARRLKDEEGFFYPHNLDFRGRAYPIHPHLNHLGSDVCRGILEFAEGRPLGKSGLHWLKIHLANLFAGGVDKLSHDGRIAFTESHLDDIFDSADKPLEGRRWWLKAEDPFQCLAVCINLSEALRSSSPETTISHIPVHQDGSCNGLQHYAALGRDKLGADAVNLIAGGEPADVYSGIAARVLKIVRDDAKKDPATFSEALCARNLVNQKDPEAFHEALCTKFLVKVVGTIHTSLTTTLLAESSLVGHKVDRKLVKQTVMTSVYGVTYIGARDQIKKRLKERGSIADDAELFRAACYAAKVTLTALGEMFEAARSIMSWLGDCAKIIASENQPVRWITPLGLPVVQPYRKFGRHHIKTSLQVLTLQRETEKVMVKRQRTAFPPNFVHSLDGSHMMMTAVACKKAGLNFAGVHDSYWTHACDVDEMNRILREKFVELYERPILENLLESFQKSFPTLSFPPLPQRGDFELKDVLESLYFFN